MSKEQEKYLRLLSEKYPSTQSVCREIVNLNAILNLPKGTEHFMSDIHGEYEAFCHILNNCSGVVKEKVDRLFGDNLSAMERQEICTLIYYPREKLNLIKSEENNEEAHSLDEWYRIMLNYLIEVAKILSSKYTRSKVRKALPHDFGYIIDELLHAQPDEDDNQVLYHKKIIDTIIRIENAEEFIVALSNLIKRLAVDHLHIVGDIFDRGACADKILDLLSKHHSLDIEWGNHDILWMGAAAGSEECVATVVHNNIKYHSVEILESGYGISLRTLTLFAEKTYHNLDAMEAALKAITVILFKLEGNLISRHPEYEMEDRRLLHKINYDNKTIEIDGHTYSMNDVDFPTVSKDNPYQLTQEEQGIIDELKNAFVNSKRLNSHVEFLYSKGGMYRVYNGNLLYHGCVPLDMDGNFDGVNISGNIYKGKHYFDYADKLARKVYFKDKSQHDLDFMWYLWCGKKSPLSGRNIKTFERAFVSDKAAWEEEVNHYYTYYQSEITCNMILREFGLYSNISHIINGHTPVKVDKGEQPIRANGKLIVIDGGFCESYHKTTGIAGYTLIYNSHGIRIKAHQPFESVYKALRENKDIESSSETVETETHRMLVEHTDIGQKISQEIEDLQLLLDAYRNGTLEVKDNL